LDQGSGKKYIPDPGVKKAPDPGLKTLPVTDNILLVNRKKRKRWMIKIVDFFS
jgi:hypothetical protein